MHNSIKKNEYVFLEDLESFLFLMEVCIYPILSFSSTDFRMQLEQYTRQHRTISGSQINKKDYVLELLVCLLAGSYEVGQPNYLNSDQN